jgi:two-component system CheB/CheR fusion protein
VFVVAAVGMTTKDKKSKKDPVSATEKPFLVVGIGASAGGVTALKNFFAAMPSDSGMAFVVILHLSQDHKSSLSEIIQRETGMPVHQVTAAVTVEPNTVYVIPPAKHLELTDGIIKPKDPIREKGVRVPIDRFFRTLADAYGRKAVTIILSGTGTDGTLGMKHIKGRDGFAIVQDPLDAEYDAMPRSAIETKIVDVILPVSEMPEKLLSVRESTERLSLTDGHDKELGKEIKNLQLLRDVLTFLRVCTGHDFTNYKRPTIIRRVARHLQIHETDDLGEYLEILRNRPDEVVSLIKNLLINVTNFFRDKDAFDALETQVVPALFEGKSGDDHVRVWIAGCSSGEEAYSMAILLNEFAAKLPEPPAIQIFASDVDDDVIAEARDGRFTEAVVHDVSPERLKNFFTKEGGFYHVRKSIRETILFASHNILRDPPFSRLDLVACRNVLIYFNRETQEKALRIFHFALRPGGHLFLGSSESAESVSNFFVAVDKKNRIYRSRPNSSSRQIPPDLPVSGVWKPKLTPVSTKGESNLQPYGQLHHQLIEHYAPPSVLVDEEAEILHSSENAGQFLRFAGGAPTNNLLKVIDPGLLPDVRAALFSARKEGRIVEAKNIRLTVDGTEHLVNILVRPVKTPDGGALVVFETSRTSAVTESVHAIVAGDKAMEGVLRRMEEELRQAKDQLRNTIEQYETSTEELRASNEELQAINEELRSATEELETGKEELQSVNEELTTVNQELKSKVDEIARINSDLENLMRSTEIATIFLDRSLNIKLYTPPAAEIFNVIPTDVGRPLKHITHSLAPDNFSADAAKVLKNLQPVEHEVFSSDGRCFIARFLPYRTVDDKIGGVVLTFIDITERHLAREEQLRLLAEITAAQQMSDAVLDQMPAGVVVASAKGRLIFGNRRMADILGHPAGGTGDTGNYANWDLRDKKDRRLGPEDMPMAKALSTGETTIGEEMYLHQSDGVTVVSVNAAPIVGPGGELVAGVLAFEDITRRVNAEKELRESEAQYRTLFESIDEGFCIIEVMFDAHRKPVDYRYLEVSPSFEKQTGLKNVKGRTMREIVPQHEDYWFETYGHIAETGEPARFEKFAAALDTWYDVYAFRFGAPEDRQVAVLFNNINPRKEAEEALRKSEERLRLMSESFTDYAIFMTDVNGRILSWNTGAEQIFGYPEAEIIGEPASRLFTPEDGESRVPEYEMETARTTGQASDERWLLRKDGGRFYASGIMVPLFEKGEMIGFAKIARDLTKRKQAEEELRRQHEELESIVAGRTAELAEANDALRTEMEERRLIEEERFALLQKIVTTQEDERRRIARDMHDSLGQQLTAFRLKLASLKSDDYSDGRIGEGLEVLQQLAKRLDSEVNFLVWELRPTILDDLGLAAAIENYVREWSRHYEIGAEFHAGRMGEERLSENVETNLYRITQEALNNTYKHARANNANVVLELRKNEIVLVIEDDGIGFEIGEVDRTSESGRGLGLIGMRERAAIIGGMIEIESSPGNGTTTFIRIPVEEPG